MPSADVTALIKPGAVLLVYCHFCTPPKKKFFVVAAVNPYVLGFLINSNPTRWQMDRPHIMCDQVQIEAATYAGFLDHDSVIDCSTAIEEYELEELIAAVAVDPASRLLGNLTAEDQERVRNVVRDSVNIEMSNIKVILKALEAGQPN